MRKPLRYTKVSKPAGKALIGAEFPQIQAM